jgi:predicted transcriptional regulator
MKVRDLNPKDAIGVSAVDTLRAAAKILADDEIGILVVWTARGPIGVFGERDLARAVADGVDLDEVGVEDYMTESPVVVKLDDPIGDVIEKMNEYGMRHVMVADDSSIFGVSSMRDVVGLLGTRWPEL